TWARAERIARSSPVGRKKNCRFQIADCRSQTITLVASIGAKGGNIMHSAEMKKRTKEFAKRVINLCRKLPRTEEARLVRNQIFRAGTSVGSNYRAVCRGRSKADFISKLGIV